MRTEEAFDALYDRVRDRGVRVLKEKFTRFAHLPEAHKSFFLADPSDNVIEAKYYFEQKYNF
jgi:hypothetical protein